MPSSSAEDRRAQPFSRTNMVAKGIRKYFFKDKFFKVWADGWAEGEGKGEVKGLSSRAEGREKVRGE